ncbi:hypothetical protein G9A89_003174 [Geosiphon pyriformis]|nr:hypothetical protein G9A89_003174 [Geosiphon pyriformis]
MEDIISRESLTIKLSKQLMKLWFQETTDKLLPVNLFYAPIAKLENFTGEEDDAQAWINDVSKAIIVNNWDDVRAL